MAALDKIFELLDEEPDMADKPDAVELPRVRGEICFDGVTFSYGGEMRRSCEVTSRCRPGRRSRWWARRVPASRRSPSWWRASTTRTPGAC